MHLPALVMLGFWIVVQLLNGLLAAGHAVATAGEADATVAWCSYLGGFLRGSLLFVLRPRLGRRL